MIHEFFDLTLKRYGIQAKALSILTGVSQNHISEFRSHKLKTGVTSDCLWRLLAGMDELAPGSLRYFCDLLAGKKKPQQGFAADLEFLIEAADDCELETAMLLIVRKMFPRGDEKFGNSANAIEGRSRINSSVPY